MPLQSGCRSSGPTTPRLAPESSGIQNLLILTCPGCTTLGLIWDLSGPRDLDMWQHAYVGVYGPFPTGIKEDYATSIRGTCVRRGVRSTPRVSLRALLHHSGIPTRVEGCYATSRRDLITYLDVHGSPLYHDPHLPCCTILGSGWLRDIGTRHCAGIAERRGACAYPGVDGIISFRNPHVPCCTSLGFE